MTWSTCAAVDQNKAISGVPSAAPIMRCFTRWLRCCADLLIGGPGSKRSKPAWSQVYRALDHGAAKSACANETMIAKFPREIQEFSRAFVQLQLKRHEADYDPDATMYKSAALANIAIVETVIKEFSNVPLKHRRAFAAWVMFKKRN
jgi:hypothetical protein